MHFALDPSCASRVRDAMIAEFFTTMSVGRNSAVAPLTAACKVQI